MVGTGANRPPLAPLEVLAMPKFMDVHHGMHGITPEALKAAHQADLDIQGDEGVDFQRAWGDPDS
ncbi:nickel-binding protein, partial [Pengzhenrongella sp.]|uniref:nickel-binding protein n=1 Tax=Pengzhenrongella sp. TaxID=2888820 RepID=UPI0039C9F472